VLLIICLTRQPVHPLVNYSLVRDRIAYAAAGLAAIISAMSVSGENTLALTQVRCGDDERHRWRDRVPERALRHDHRATCSCTDSSVPTTR
jgi:hypothetical protein